MKPALTPEEWADKHKPFGPMYSDSHPETPEEAHAIAAKCLYGQPFGFTHEDVEALRGLDDFVLAHTSAVRKASTYDNLADRIEALLPPVAIDPEKPNP